MLYVEVKIKQLKKIRSIVDKKFSLNSHRVDCTMDGEIKNMLCYDANSATKVRLI